MNIGRATEYRNTSQLFMDVKLVKNYEQGAVKCRRHSKATTGCEVWGGGINLFMGWGQGPRKKFRLFFEMLNFYVGARR